MAPGGWPLLAGIYSIENYAAICPMYLDKLESSTATRLKVQSNIINGQPKLDVSQLWILRKVTLSDYQCYTIQNYATETYLSASPASNTVSCSPGRASVGVWGAWIFVQQANQTFNVGNLGLLLEVEDCPPRDQVEKDRNIINCKYVQTWTDKGQEAIRWYCNKFENYDSCNWMSGIPDATLIRELTIPATHQSHALDTAAGWQEVVQSPKCQDGGVYSQLRAGIRYLDVRIDVNMSEMRVIHGIWAMDTPFNQVLNAIWEFLDTYRREIVILRLNREQSTSRITGESTFLDYLRDCLKPYWSMFVRGSTENPLSMFRGKCLLVTGDDINQLHYRERFWPQDKENSKMLDAIAMTSGYFTDALRWDGQDIWENLSVAEKMQRVRDHLAASTDGGNSQRCFYTGINMSKLNDYYPRQRSDELNPLLQATLDNLGRANRLGRIGIIGMDFPTQNLIRTLIRFNGVTIGDSLLVEPRVNSTQ